MWERKVLRGMGLVDCAPAIVAHDAEGKALRADEESLEVTHGLAFVKLSVLLHHDGGDQKAAGTTARVETRELMSGRFGGIAFKCDYCSVVCDREMDLLHHMERAKHDTGSTVLTYSRGQGEEGEEEEEEEEEEELKARCIIVPGFVRPRLKPFRELVPVCPVCLDVFEEIMDCARHTYTHGGITGVFQLLSDVLPENHHHHQGHQLLRLLRPLLQRRPAAGALAEKRPRPAGGRGALADVLPLPQRRRLSSPQRGTWSRCASTCCSGTNVAGGGGRW